MPIGRLLMLAGLSFFACITILQAEDFPSDLPTLSQQGECADILLGRSSVRSGLSGSSRGGDLKTFGRAMTEGMLLRPEQGDLFEIYRKIFFGDSTQSANGATLKTVAAILAQHPDLGKPHFREYEVERVEKVYGTPESLRRHLKSQSLTAGQIRSNLFQIESNLEFWKKILNYEDSPMPENLSQEEAQKFRARMKARFIKHLDQFVAKKNRDELKDERVDYRTKIKTLFNVLRRTAREMELNGRGSHHLRQAMVDLVATSGFHNPSIQARLKSKNGLEKIEGLKKIADERDLMAMELGYRGHFKNLLADLKMTYTSLTGQRVDEAKAIADLEAAVLNQPVQSVSKSKIRVRSLSIQEAPFRGCLGGSDCSTRTYFSQALDPNFNYFTMTDAKGHSSGHVTVVLGRARDDRGRAHKVAFIDKLQNVPNSMVMSFLEAVRLSLGEEGYLLGVPEELGDESGLSNMASTRLFVKDHVLPLLRRRLIGFSPHSHPYKFESVYKYTRANLGLSIRVFEYKDKDSDIEIRPGRKYEPHLADASLNKGQLVQDLIRLRDSANEVEVQKYVSSSHIVSGLEDLGLFSQKKYLQDLLRISSNNRLSFKTRKMAFFEIFMIPNRDGLGSVSGDYAFRFSNSERAQMVSELRQWAKSTDDRKAQFINRINETWFESARHGNVALANGLLFLRLVDINQKNAMGHTAFMIAMQNRRMQMIKALLSDPDLNLYERDNGGFTAFDHALALGHQDVRQMIESLRPDVKWNKDLDAIARVHKVIDFIRVEPGSFKMGPDLVDVTITRPFEIMSTPVTQKMYLKIMGENPAYFKEGENSVVMNIQNKLHKLRPDHPVENLLHRESDRFLQKINELSLRDDPLLYEIIPDHKSGAQYDFTTEAQLEYVMRSARTENGDAVYDMLQRADREKLSQYAWFDGSILSGSTQPVGTKKPLFVSGRPIYDLFGNVNVLTKDGWESRPPGGVDPMVWGHVDWSGRSRVVRGGSWAYGLEFLGDRQYAGADERSNTLGLLLVRVCP